MNLLALCIALQKDEGYRAKPYQDRHGGLSVGYGRNLMSLGLTEPEARFLLENDCTRVMSEITNQWPWVAQLDDVRQNVLYNMGFNLGLPTLKTFRKFLAALQARDYMQAAEAMMDSEWANQVGKRATRLATEMATGEEKPVA